jgi:uncharacterized protein YaiI (UPF0178 family)
MPSIYVDADACPVKDEVYRVARRYGWPVLVVSGQGLLVPREPLIQGIMVGDKFDAADDWIAERIGPGDIAITGDIPLAARCLEKGARVVDHRGGTFTETSIGSALATRALMQDLRDMGTVRGGGPPMGKADRSRFLATLDGAIQASLRQPR